VLALSTLVGSLPTWLLFALSVAVALRLSRGGAGSAVSELSKANEVLDRRLQEERKAREALGAEVRDLNVRNAELGKETNFAIALEEARSAAEARALEALSRHETRAIERHEAQLVILGLIADRLGREPDTDPER
jgi:biopolymer transport protein ExbB/TolQ